MRPPRCLCFRAQENPKSAQAHLRNPDIMRKLNKLMAAGIIQMK